MAHSEPVIQTVELDSPARTLADAADAADDAVRVFARSLLASQRAERVVPPPPPTAAARAKLRAAFDARLPERLAKAQGELSASVGHERANAATVLGRYRHRPAEDDLRALLSDPYPQVRDDARAALARITNGES